MVTLAAALQAMVTATRRMRRYCITESNAGALMKVPRVARGTGSRPFGQGHITHDGGRSGEAVRRASLRLGRPGQPFASLKITSL